PLLHPLWQPAQIIAHSRSRSRPRWNSIGQGNGIGNGMWVPYMSSSPQENNLPDPSEIESLTARLNALDQALNEHEDASGEDTMTQWDGPPPAELPPPLPDDVTEELTEFTDVATPPPIPEAPAPVAEAALEKVAAPRPCPICGALR